MLPESIYENGMGQTFLSKYGKVLYVKKTAYNCLSITATPAPTYDENEHLIDSDSSIMTVNNDIWKEVNLLLCGKLMYTLWLTYGDDFHLMPSMVDNFMFPWNKVSHQDKLKLQYIYNKFENRLSATLSFKLNAKKNVGTYNVRDLWSITDESDLIFLKYMYYLFL